jgi:hypothetical protein
MPLRPRKKPPVLAQRTYDGEDRPEQHPRATITVQNIYENYPVPWPEGVVEQKKIKWMRIVQFIPKTTPGENNPRVGNYDMATCRMSLGIVPVEDDGSVYCDAPINKPIYFQALDENQRDAITITVPSVTPASVGALIALYERAVGLYASLININAYHQPGVEAGKKAAAGILDLQARAIAAVQQTAAPLTLETLAAKIGAEKDIETLYQILRHLNANQRHIQFANSAANLNELQVTSYSPDGEPT